MNQPRPESLRFAIGNAGRVCLFGAGVLLDECWEQLVSSLGKVPDLICDNAPEKWGTEFRGIKCISPGELSVLREGTTVVITIRKHEEIHEQLRSMGISDILVACFDTARYCLRTIGRLDADLPDTEEKPPVIDVRGKWTLVTGASRGVGRQIAMAMARLGSNIIAHSRSLSHVSGLLETCSSLGVEIVPIAAELSNPDELERMLTELDRIAPQVDILFNNAAFAPHFLSGFKEDVPVDTMRTYYSVNVVAPIRICQHLLAGMIRRGFGRVINLTSYVRPQSSGEIIYASSKAALDQFAYGSLPVISGTGVMMSMAEPGWVRTDSGGKDATYPIATVIPGILLGALLDFDVNGHRFSAQEYSGLSIHEATLRAKARLLRFGRSWV
ncbi:MAG: SDR family NAD(P)-dependent oxidoreductase [Syntrophobacteraceae bacterium]